MSITPHPTPGQEIERDLWLDSFFEEKKYYLARPELDVYISDVFLSNNPAVISYIATVGALEFHSQITYHSIPNWNFIVNPFQKKALIGTVVAWDSMRFLALGGERVVLPDNLTLTEQVSKVWRRCFLSQFGEWRYRNQIHYAQEDLPKLECQVIKPSDLRAKIFPRHKDERWLLTNGGGKDSFTGMLLLNEVGVPYDLYEGCLPLGGTLDLQKNLLRELGKTVAPSASSIQVTVEDDFYTRPLSQFRNAGIEAEFFKTDFFIGHTANYAGFFPLLMFHGYTRMWFNIERSADEINAMWNNEEIRHQWCKSQEYQFLMTELYSALAGRESFDGFGSTLGSLHDTMIYKVVTREPELLRQTHSCNYGKPWCARCPKCLFCYLMMASYLGEPYAIEVLGVQESLLEVEALLDMWKSLFDSQFVAWECVASTEECAFALGVLSQHQRIPLALQKYVPDPEMMTRLAKRYTHINWAVVPEVLKPSLKKLMHNE